MASASVSWASFDSEPCDMAPVEKRRGDLGGRLDLVERDGSPAGGQLEQVVQLDGRPVVDQRGERRRTARTTRPDGPLEQVGGGHVAVLPVVGLLLHQRRGR